MGVLREVRGIEGDRRSRFNKRRSRITGNETHPHLAIAQLLE
ncbi:hypothetical protein [Nostoc sp. LPT]|nr:hypothetical protein [Nostoc sp. LPT]